MGQLKQQISSVTEEVLTTNIKCCSGYDQPPNFLNLPKRYFNARHFPNALPAIVNGYPCYILTNPYREDGRFSCGTGSDYPSGEHELTLGLCCSIFSFLCSVL
jgi:hypothetical protein